MISSNTPRRRLALCPAGPRRRRAFWHTASVSASADATPPARLPGRSRRRARPLSRRNRAQQVQGRRVQIQTTVVRQEPVIAQSIHRHPALELLVAVLAFPTHRVLVIRRLPGTLAAPDAIRRHEATVRPLRVRLRLATTTTRGTGHEPGPIPEPREQGRCGSRVSSHRRTASASNSSLRALQHGSWSTGPCLYVRSHPTARTRAYIVGLPKPPSPRTRIAHVRPRRPHSRHQALQIVVGSQRRRRRAVSRKLDHHHLAVSAATGDDQRQVLVLLVVARGTASVADEPCVGSSTASRSKVSGHAAAATSEAMEELIDHEHLAESKQRGSVDHGSRSGTASADWPGPVGRASARRSA